MSPLAISSIAFACILGGTLIGMLLRQVLPEDHLNQESKDAVKLGIGMISTLTALVLGLLTASAKTTSDTATTSLRKAGAQIVMLDRVLAQYGSETLAARDLLRQSVTASIERIWPEDMVGATPDGAQNGRVEMEAIYGQLIQLSPPAETQRLLHSRALQICSDMVEGRRFLIERVGQSSLPTPFLVVLIFWITFIFTSFGLFSPCNHTVMVVLIICALSAAGSLFLMLELDTPYGGLIKVSSSPLHRALKHIGDLATGLPQ
jgi:hypothetical protein